ncbi:hypothetical protein [Paracoccus actinidiae]|uniref:hypothetical protein n=1 Tax=Paracoccus actinidiae TaxID=3064531 RepID=UPI0027D1EE3E|nr:hypothetical protein [Paracoccus sp. M09]
MTLATTQGLVHQVVDLDEGLEFQGFTNNEFFSARWDVFNADLEGHPAFRGHRDEIAAEANRTPLRLTYKAYNFRIAAVRSF